MKDQTIRAKELNCTLTAWDSLSIDRTNDTWQSRWVDAYTLLRHGRIIAKLGAVHIDDEGTIVFPDFTIEVYRPRRRRGWWRR